METDMPGKSIQDTISRISQPPTLPEVVMHLIRVVDDPATSASEVSRIISRDQSLTTSVLKLVNSPFYGMSRQITTLTQATVVLGFTTIRNIALTAAIFDEFGGGSTAAMPGGYSRAGFWEHSISCAIAARCLAGYAAYADTEQAFISGLIHDLGKVVLDEYLHEDFRRVLELAEQEKMRIREAEQHIFGTDHAEVGGWLARRWNLPDSLVAVIENHHNPTQSQVAPKLAALVHLADIIVRMQGYGHAGDNSNPVIDRMLWVQINISEEAMPSILDDIAEKYHEARDFIEMVRGDV